MRIYVPAHVADSLNRTGKLPYQRKNPTTTEDYARMRKAETRRRLRQLARTR